MIEIFSTRKAHLSQGAIESRVRLRHDMFARQSRVGIVPIPEPAQSARRNAA
jgi:hypothetical protein